MSVLDVRQRTGWLLTAVTVGHIVLISTQVQTRPGVPVIEAIAFGVFAEVQRAVAAVLGGGTDTWQRYVALQRVDVENEQLRGQLARLNIELQRERAVAQQARGLQQLLDLQVQLTLDTTGATVIGAGASVEFRTMTINKGTGAGLRSDMAVIAPGGVVGRIIMPTARASKVQMLIDRNAAAGVIVERSRAQGIVIGTGTDRLTLEYLSGTADVKIGDRVVTSGIDGIYPKGFVIGQIESIQRGAGEFGAVIIRPAVDMSSLEEVLVVLTPPAIDLVEADTAEKPAQ
jgi:rod shape-determining protein MreC